MGFWDSPDGEDCPKKLWETTRLGAGLGLVGSAYHIVALPPKNAFDAVQRGVNGTMTMATLGAIFGITTCLTAHLRGTDNDPLNYFIGGCASGVLFGYDGEWGDVAQGLVGHFTLKTQATHNYLTGTGACLSLGAVAALTKIGKMEGWRISGPPRL